MHQPLHEDLARADHQERQLDLDIAQRRRLSREAAGHDADGSGRQWRSKRR